MSKKDKRVMLKNLSIYLTEMDSFIRATAYTDDVFQSYSFSEALLERQAVIGVLEEAQSSYGKYALTGTGSPDEKSSLVMNPSTGRMTLQAELLKLKAEGLWAISKARELEEEMKKATPAELEKDLSDNPEVTTDEETEDAIIMSSS